MQGNPQVKFVVGNLAVGLLATFVKRHSPFYSVGRISQSLALRRHRSSSTSNHAWPRMVQTETGMFAKEENQQRGKRRSLTKVDFHLKQSGHGTLPGLYNIVF